MSKKKKYIYNMIISVTISKTLSILFPPLIHNHCVVVVVVVYIVLNPLLPFLLPHLLQLSMSITTMPAFKFLTVAESCLLSQPSLFSSKTRYPIVSNSLKTLKLQLPCSNSSPFSPSLSTTHRSPLLTFVAQTSDWAQQEEEGGAAWENEGEPTWANEDSDETEGGEEVVASAEPSEDLKIFVGNLPWDVESENLAMLFEEAGSVEFAEVSS